jgi:hypothetical protein
VQGTNDDATVSKLCVLCGPRSRAMRAAYCLPRALRVRAGAIR